MESKAEQYYPTYNAQHRDVLLLEFEEAQKIANGQTKVYGQVTNILLAAATFTFSFLLDEDDKKASDSLRLFLSNSTLFSLILFSFGAIILRYFVDLQRQITINARKVVTLRTLLGLDYGHINLTLPNWRVEGATNPFVIKYFNGWFYFKAMPFWVVTITVNAFWLIATSNVDALNLFKLNYGLFQPALTIPYYFGNIFFTLSYVWLFRRKLNDRHETLFLVFTKALFKFLGIKVVNNFEYIIYRAKLSYIELDRLNVKYSNLMQILVDIEDTTFYNNPGVSLKSLLRGGLSRFRFFRKRNHMLMHGGSTITMQLARSLFIPVKQNKYLRKIAEIFLAFWLYGQFSKAEILKMYIASVRYERGILGLAKAVNYFFADIKQKELSNEEAFFLVERLSNISSTIRQDRIDFLSQRTKIVLVKEKLNKIYKRLKLEGKLK